MLKIKRFFLSRKTVFSLICAVGISCIIGTTIPQVARRPPHFFETWAAESPRIYYLIDLLQLNQVYTSVWFLVLVALIASSLTYSIYYQSKTLIKSSRPAQREISPQSFKHFYAMSMSKKNPIVGAGSEIRVEGLSNQIRATIEAGGYRPCVIADGSKYLIFRKNRWGRWGSVIFHMGLLVIIAAALYGLAFQKRGFVQMIQTDTFSGEDEDWPQKRLGVFARDFDLRFEVHLDEFVPTYWENDQVKDLETHLTVVDRKGRSHKFLVSPGNPMHYRGTKIYQTVYYGYALGFILKKENGSEKGTHFLLDAPGKKDQPFKGKMDFPPTEYVLDMKFHPNLIEPSFFATLPGVYLTVTEKEEERFNGRVLFSQTAGLGKDSLTFAQIHYWTGLAFVKNNGMPLVYSGFTLGTLGAMLIFFLPYKQLSASIGEDENQIQISIGGRTKRYGALFSEEFKEMAERLEKGLGEHGGLYTLIRPASLGERRQR